MDQATSEEAPAGYQSPAAANRLELDIIGAVLGTDKSSVVSYGWDYLRHYDSLFHPFRDDAINVVEIGVAGGQSLRTWQWYFSAATIIGVDIEPTARRFARGRTRVEIGSQADVHFMRRLCRDYPPTIFIDDGSHLAEHNIVTFEAVFPRLLPGGLYVVEDLAFHLGPRASGWQSDTPRNAPEYFLDLARSCLARHNIPGAERVPKQLLSQVDSVTFINSAAIIRKRGARVGLDEAIEGAVKLIADAKLGTGACERLALFIVRHGGTLAQAQAACEAAIEAGSRSLPLWCLYADTMLRDGRKREAAAALFKAIANPEKDTPQRQAVAALLSETGLTPEVFGQVCGIVESEQGRLVAHPLRDVLHGLKALP